MNKLQIQPGFPVTRLRRLRKNAALREMFRETHLHRSDLIYPVFVVEGDGIKKEISSMPGQFQMSIDNVVRECEELQRLGLNSILLFGIPAEKDEVGSDAYDENGIIQKALRAIKKEFPEIVAITDVCLCEYTSHGHCGVIENGDVQNDATLDLLVKEALSHAQAGADVIAPSDMMDGRVGAIRSALDKNGFADIPKWLTRQSIRRRFTDRFARQPNRRLSSATEGATRWIRRIRTKQFARSHWIFKRVRTS